jgi:putative cell wall-binding protein
MHNVKKSSIFLILFIDVILQFCFSGRVVAASTIVRKRLWGATRYETAAAISNTGWKTSVYAVLASGEDFPDALCSAPLAKKLNNAPILLTQKDALNSSAEQQLQRLGVKTVYIVGGTGVISTDIEKRVKELGMDVIRIAGADRYETSVKVAEQVGFDGQIVIASGENFADALSIAPIAAEKNMPILLTRASAIPESVKTYLSNKDISSSYIIGGAGAVSDEAIKDIKNTKRLWGASRYETNTAVLSEFYSSISHTNIYIASGDNYADAVSGAALAAANNSGMILTGSTLGNSAGNFLSSRMMGGVQIYIYGGTGAVTDTAVNQILQSVGYVSLVNTKSYEMGEKITVTNDGTSAVRNFSAVLHLGKINESPYQKNETLYIDGPGAVLTKDADGNYIANINVSYIAQGQTIQYTAVRRFINGGIVYNMDISDAIGDYTGFNDYDKYTAAEQKIESDNLMIKTKAEQVTAGETNNYMKAKKIFDFVNMYMTYDYSEANKGAVNALTTAKGVCEDYSDLMVAMLRAEGIPSRSAYGYWLNSDEIASGSSDITSFRHSWVEFYLPEYGWIFAEPTVDYKVNGQKVPADNYFANYKDGGHFVQTYTDDGGFSCSYSGYSHVNIEDVPYITILGN